MDYAIAATLLGGIGLFILGMILMTEGLKTLAGDSLRRILSRFAGGRVSSIIAGASVTALAQSSHATIIATIGFVSAGLMTFQSSIGVILGANLGTTGTGWLVSILGLKFKIGAIALPVVGIGALIRLLGRDRIAGGGLILAGFGLIFVGISVLQEGMRGLSGLIDFSSFEGSSIIGRLLLVGAGVVMTIVMQTSSAALATTMAALSTHSIDLIQAAALVIGQNIGTTLTAAIAALGATTPAKRTAVAHIFFNALMGTLAFLVLPVLMPSLSLAARFCGIENAAITLAAFNTLINLIGIIIIFPFLEQLARIIARMVPEKGSRFTRYLDVSLLHLPSVAVEAVRRAVIEITITMIDIIRDMVASEKSLADFALRVKEADDALTAVKSFMSKIKTNKGVSPSYNEHFLDAMHAIDHVDQLIIASRQFESVREVKGDQKMNFIAMTLADHTAPVIEHLAKMKRGETAGELEETSRFMKRLREQRRLEIMQQTSHGEIDPDTALRQIEALRWLERVTYRIYRTLYYLGRHGGNGIQFEWIESEESRIGVE